MENRKQKEERFLSEQVISGAQRTGELYDRTNTITPHKTSAAFEKQLNRLAIRAGAALLLASAVFAPAIVTKLSDDQARQRADAALHAADMMANKIPNQVINGPTRIATYNLWLRQYDLVPYAGDLVDSAPNGFSLPTPQLASAYSTLKEIDSSYALFENHLARIEQTRKDKGQAKLTQSQVMAIADRFDQDIRSDGGRVHFEQSPAAVDVMVERLKRVTEPFLQGDIDNEAHAHYDGPKM